MRSRYVVCRDDIEPRQAAGSPAQVRALLTESFGCTFLTQAVPTIAPGTTLPHNSGPHEELLFVLRGHGNLLLDGTDRPFGPESGIYIGPDETLCLPKSTSVLVRATRLLVSTLVCLSWPWSVVTAR